MNVQRSSQCSLEACKVSGAFTGCVVLCSYPAKAQCSLPRSSELSIVFLFGYRISVLTIYLNLDSDIFLILFSILVDPNYLKHVSITCLLVNVCNIITFNPVCVNLCILLALKVLQSLKCRCK